MKKKYIYILGRVGLKFGLINHPINIEFVDSGLVFVKDENNFKNPL